MSILSEIEKIKERTFSLVLLSILLLIAPGVLIIFEFYRDLFSSMDSIKLILLSLAIITPFVFINFFAQMKTEKQAEDDIFFSMLLSIIFSGLVLYIVSLFKLFINKDIHYFIYLAMIIVVIFFGLIVLVTHSEKKGN